MALLEDSAPRSVARRKERGAADQRAAIVAGVGFALTFVSLAGLPGPDGFFMGAAPVIGAVCVFPALMAMWMQPYRGGFARLLLLIGAIALAAGGVAYLRSASTPHVVIAYFVPAVLLAAAATILALPRARVI